MINLANPVLDEEMKQAMVSASENERFVLGESVYKFEEEFAKYCGVKHAVAMNSGTTALHLSLLALGIKKGDRVITTPNSFIATANCILYANALPVFSDIEPDTGNIDPFKIKVGGAKAILPVHLYGQPCDIDSLKETGLPVIEDACQAHGALYKGKKAGSVGDTGCFSFYPSKNMTVGGDGGMATTNNNELAEKMRMMRDCGRTTKYNHTMIGYTARLNTINAAIGRVQLKRLDLWNEKRRELALLYKKLLPKGILLTEKEYAQSVYHMFVIKVDERDKLRELLKKNEVETGIHYPAPIHLQPIYRELFGYKGGELPAAEEFSKKCLSIPLHPGLSHENIKFVAEKIMEFIVI